MGRIRFLLALWAGKAVRLVLKALGRNATYFPGHLAVKICPDFLARVGKPGKIAAITGSNGKTTVSNLIIDVLERSGRRVLSNRLGSNVAAGIATSLLAGCGLTGKPRYDMAVLEVDERSSRRIYPHVRPDWLVITNLFRDSPMRNAHPQYIAGIIESAVPPTTKLILNADDLISSRLCPKNPRAYFGIDRMPTDVKECVNLINDVQVCPVCCGELEYMYRRYHHIGRARCLECGLESPKPDYLAKDVDTAAMTFTVVDGSGEATYRLLSDSVFNIYNMVAAIAALREMELSHDEIRKGLESTKIVETRYNAQKVGDITVIMQMSKDKNALAGSRAFDYISSLPGKKEVVLMMNCIHDQKRWSENVTWLYDCDFEFLNNDSITRIVAAGPRAKDYYLRLLFAGVPEDRLYCTLDEMKSPEMLSYEPGTSVCLLYGTDAFDLVYRVHAKIRRLALEAFSR